MPPNMDYSEDNSQEHPASSQHVHFHEPLNEDRPTVKGSFYFNAENEANRMHEALKHLVAKNSMVMEILTQHNNEQRRKIADLYKKIYHKDLASTIKHELNIFGHYEDVLLALLQIPSDYDAEQLHHALTGPGMDVDTLIEILCSRNNDELNAIRISYLIRYNRDLDKVIEHDTKGEFEHLLLAILSANRDESDIVDMVQAKADAEEMYQAEVHKWHHSESSFIRIMTHRNYRQLLTSFQEFEKLASIEIEKSVQAHMQGDLRNLTLTIIKFVKNKHAFFAECLFKSMKFLGINDRKLIRIIVDRSEKDLGNIREEFVKMYGKTLESVVEGDTSGNYKHVLLALLGVPFVYH